MKTATSLSLSQAAEAAGIVKSTLSKAHKAGDVAAFRDDKGRLWFEPGELERVYGTLKTPGDAVSQDEDEIVSEDTDHPAGNGTGNAVLKVQLEFLREKIALLDKLKESEIGQLTARIEELRRDKDDLRTERDKLLTTVQELGLGMRLLTDQRKPVATADPAPSTEPAAPSAPRRMFGWLRR